MKLVTPRNVMLDGARTGASLGSIDNSESKMELSTEESAVFRRMMTTAGATQVNRDLIFPVVRKGTTMHLTMRADESNAKKKYLNLSGNPLTFITGDNVYGSPNPVKQLKFCWNKCLDRLENAGHEKAPKRVRQDVEEAKIFVHSLEWASYTGRMSNPRLLLNHLHAMFHLTKKRRADGMHEFLAELLNVQWIDSQYKDSFRLKILDKNSRTVSMFGMYDKPAEIMRRAAEAGKSEQQARMSIPDDIKNRLRVEISLQHLWFKNKRILTLADLVKHVEKVHEADWSTFVNFEMTRVLDRTHLVRMFEIDGEAVLKAQEEGLPFVPGMPANIPTDLLVHMVTARVLMDMDIKQEVQFLKSDKKLGKWIKNKVRDIKPLPDARKFMIDTSIVDAET